MDMVTINDQKRYELALAMGILAGYYTVFSAKLTAEQCSLDWERVIKLAEINT